MTYGSKSGVGTTGDVLGIVVVANLEKNGSKDLVYEEHRMHRGVCAKASGGEKKGLGIRDVAEDRNKRRG
jgi:hypothetical protein